ncbi:MAG: Oxygen sensor histidine kinase NreB [Gemmatimonadaceae bacterium]|nr:Oxygen sensor histidine kinase NreB [Gemmatimonadaceae bacterium]
MSSGNSETIWNLYLTLGLAAAVILFALISALVIYQRRFVKLHRTYSKNLLSAQEEERAWVAREVHDDALQRVAMLAHELHEVADEPPGNVDRQRQRIGAIVTEVEDLGVMLRRVAHRLHPSLIDQAGLVPALEGLAGDVSRAHGIQVDVEIPPSNAIPGVPRDVALILYRIAQEGLRNVARHSGVKRASLRVVPTQDNELSLEIVDRGRGFVHDDHPKSHKGLGLVSMAERARLADGRLEVWSEPGKGTRLRAIVPAHQGEVS